MTTIALIDYGAGNLRSAAKALIRAAEEAGLAAEVRLVTDGDELSACERIVLPGVGAFADCMSGLMRLPGVAQALEERVLRQGAPFLGICVGMQLMASRGFEFGSHEGLGWIAGDVRPIEPEGALKVPHMGWNEVRVRSSDHGLLKGLARPGKDPYAYFVHSYAFYPQADETVLAASDYGGRIPAIVGRDNLIGTQFHPEKSQAFGLALLSAFLRWRP